MSNKLRDVFYGTPEIDKTFRRMVEKGREAMPETVSLIRATSSKILLASSPLQRFKRDCEHCKHYIDSAYHFVEGGCCDKHKEPCGWGFTCKSWTQG